MKLKLIVSYMWLLLFFGITSVFGQTDYQVCEEECPTALGFNILGRDSRTTYDERVCKQLCKLRIDLKENLLLWLEKGHSTKS